MLLSLYISTRAGGLLVTFAGSFTYFLFAVLVL